MEDDCIARHSVPMRLPDNVLNNETAPTQEQDQCLALTMLDASVWRQFEDYLDDIDKAALALTCKTMLASLTRCGTSQLSVPAYRPHLAPDQVFTNWSCDRLVRLRDLIIPRYPAKFRPEGDNHEEDQEGDIAPANGVNSESRLCCVCRVYWDTRDDVWENTLLFNVLDSDEDVNLVHTWCSGDHIRSAECRRGLCGEYYHWCPMCILVGPVE